MDLTENDSTIKNLPQPQQIMQQLETLLSQVPSILADFQKYYVFYNKNPEYPEYQQMFQNIKGNLNNNNSQLFTLSNDVQINTDKINEKLFALDLLIRKEKQKNKNFKIKLGIVENKSNASSELISDYTQMYDYEYLRNWALFLSILIAGVTISKVFKTPTV